MYLITIDPGIHTGICWLQYSLEKDGKAVIGRLHSATFSTPMKGEFEARVDVMMNGLGSWLGCFEKPDGIWIERPFFSSRRIEVAESQDLIKLTLIAGRIWQACNHYFGAVNFVDVTKWKGQVPKNISTNRTKRKLKERGWDHGEKQNEKATQHQWDAVGIAVYILEEKKRGESVNDLPCKMGNADELFKSCCEYIEWDEGKLKAALVLILYARYNMMHGGETWRIIMRDGFPKGKGAHLVGIMSIIISNYEKQFGMVEVTNLSMEQMKILMGVMDGSLTYVAKKKVTEISPPSGPESAKPGEGQAAS